MATITTMATTAKSYMATESSSSSSSLKRRSSSPSLSSPLDCQSLQSSLKRVRLSCSPGELRLQRDLRSLKGWDAVSQDCWARLGGAHLTLENPLRLILHSEGARFWIQIPRMYPHRPPTIARMEGVTWMRHVVVQDTPHVSQAPPPDCCGNTVIYQWSPVMHLGDLIDFLLESRRTVKPRPRLRPSSPTHASGISTFAALPTSTFVEEHKMEDDDPHVAYQNQQRRNHDTFFPPNRFDVGYGKYMDLLATTTTTSNAMDMND